MASSILPRRSSLNSIKSLLQNEFERRTLVETVKHLGPDRPDLTIRQWTVWVLLGFRVGFSSTHWLGVSPGVFRTHVTCMKLLLKNKSSISLGCVGVPLPASNIFLCEPQLKFHNKRCFLPHQSSKTGYCFTPKESEPWLFRKMCLTYQHTHLKLQFTRLDLAPGSTRGGDRLGFYTYQHPNQDFEA